MMLWHTAKMVQEWFEKHGVFKVLTRPLNPPALNLIEHLWDVVENKSLIHRGPISQSQAFAANVLVLDTTGHCQRSVESMCQQV